MDAAASVVSLIQFTITGLIVIRQTFSSIREGPEVVTDTVKNVHHLLHILKRLESSHAVKESQDEVLSDVLKSCHADVTRMVQKLEKLDFKASDKMGFKLWRSVKSALKEKELMDFRVKMHRYSSSLATFITIEDSDKLFEMNRKMDDAHRFIQKELLCLSEKCDRIEVKCDEVGATARNPRLQGTRIVGPMRQIIQNQLQQLVGQHGLSYSQAEIPIDFQQAGAIEGLASSLSTIAATKNPRARADQLSNLAKNWESDIEFECDATRSIVKDITALVEGLKTLTAAVAMLETQPQIGKSTTGQQIQGMLLYPELRYTPDALLSPPIENQVSTETGYNVPEDRHWDLAEVLANSRSLQDFFSRDRIRLTVVVDKPAMVNRQTLARLLQWSRISSTSQTLWTRGRYTPTRDLENHMTRIGLKLVNFAHEIHPKVLMISYFCQLGAHTSIQPNEIAEMNALTSVIYALIRQIIEILPPKLEISTDLSERRFQCLDGTKGTWKDALLILEDVVGHINQPVFCILDGVQWLEHSSTEKSLRKLLEVLRHEYLHVLFITTGSSASLCDTVSMDETLGDQDLRVGALKEDLGRHSQKFWK